MWSSGLGFASIERLLERRGTDTAVGVDEFFLWVEPEAEIGLDDLLDGVGDLLRREAAADDFADRRVLVGGAAQRHLIELGALLLDAEDADMADMVMAAGIDAAGDLQLQLADLALALQRGEALRDFLRDRDRARGG